MAIDIRSGVCPSASIPPSQLTAFEGDGMTIIYDLTACMCTTVCLSFIASIFGTQSLLIPLRHVMTTYTTTCFYLTPIYEGPHFLVSFSHSSMI